MFWRRSSSRVVFVLLDRGELARYLLLSPAAPLAIIPAGRMRNEKRNCCWLADGQASSLSAIIRL
jgi:hypothetical protein